MSNRCKAKTELGNDCMRTAQTGSEYCSTHARKLTVLPSVPDDRYPQVVLDEWPVPPGNDDVASAADWSTADSYGFTDAHRRNAVSRLMRGRNAEVHPRLLWEGWLKANRYTEKEFWKPGVPTMPLDRKLNLVLGAGTCGWLTEAECKQLGIDPEEANRVRPGCVRPELPKREKQFTRPTAFLLERAPQQGHPEGSVVAETQQVVDRDGAPIEEIVLEDDIPF